MDSRVSTTNGWLHIKIGGDTNAKKKETNKYNRIKSTKYTLLTFLPQNLLEQFRRIANFYFLVMTIISLLIDSPVSPMTSLLPLVFVIALTAAKQGYEDFLRYKTDNFVNFSPVSVIRNGAEVTIQAQHIKPGDLIVVEHDCDVPCDLVLLRSTDAHGKCFVTTANLDGETNLKMLTVPRDLPMVDIAELQNLGYIECENSKTDLYSFNGKIELTSEAGIVLPLSADNVLLRGSRVKNTHSVIGCAIYCGMSTKLQLNSRFTRVKSASSETYINKFLIFILIVMIAIVTILYFLKRYDELFVVPKFVYLGPPIETYSVNQFLQDYLSFLILFNYLIPISLYVTIEMQRIIGSLFLEWDIHLYEEPTDQHCIVNTSNLNEELGQINLLFSDKTGTLTKNEMFFKHCSIAGRKYVYHKTRIEEDGTGTLYDVNKFDEQQSTFFYALAICHTVQITSKPDDNQNDGQSNNINNGNNSIVAPKIDLPAVKNDATSALTISHIIGKDNDFLATTTQNAAVNVMETSLSENFKAQNNAHNFSDVNPLLTVDDNVKQIKRPQIVRRSPNFTRRSMRVHPSISMPSDGNAVELRKHLSLDNYAKSLSNLPCDRSVSLNFKRSISEIDLPDLRVFDGKKIEIGHKRSQSQGAPSSYITQNRNSANISTIPEHRTASFTSRESYAAPTFVRQPTLFIRAESQRRKNEIKRVVDVLDYQASSPDEKALVEACANLGIVYMSDDDEMLHIRIIPPHIDRKLRIIGKAQDVYYKRLFVLEFTSDRKRMSVIVEDKTGTKWIYTKGAESYVFPLCANSSSDLVKITNDHINEYAVYGLRTLAVARRKISEEEYAQFVEDIAQANKSLENRKELSEKCYSNIEQNLDLIGATAVEDALQDDVSNTLISLQKAGIKIWVLTGDKVETALNIALSCGHIPQNANKYIIVDCADKEHMLEHLDSLNRDIIFGIGTEYALLIDGKSLTVALNETPKEFAEIAIKCIAVLCCRLSPLQKSEVVALIKKSPNGYITAAIGDGANDVSMIQEAHVGIGLIGHEGRQAARCADFAIAKFCMLKRLLLVHGHYFSTRISLLVLYFFYKNILFMGIMFIFQFHSMFSSSSVYDSFYLTLYNVLYTSLPVLFISLTEKTYTEETLLSKPLLYKENIDNKQLHWRYFLSWVAFAIYHTLIIFYGTYFMFSYNNVILNGGQTVAFSCFGTLLIWLVVIVANMKLWVESFYLSYWYIVTLVGSILVFMITTVIYNVINLDYDTDIYWAYNNLLCSLPVWLLVIFATIACLLPDYVLKVVRKALNLPKFSIFPGKGIPRYPQFLRKSQSTHL